MRTALACLMLVFTLAACGIKPGQQRYRRMAEVDTTGMTDEQAAEAQRRAEAHARQQQFRDQQRRQRMNLRDVGRASQR